MRFICHIGCTISDGYRGPSLVFMIEYSVEIFNASVFLVWKIRTLRKNISKTKINALSTKLCG